MSGRECRPVGAQPSKTLRDFRHNLLGGSRRIAEVVRLAAKAAENDSTVLICGETGTGKELVARAIHENSSRAAGPFIAVNCAAVPEHLMESEMFGYEPGAFTGALDRRIGDFELASGGTLFLDEVGELSLPMQPKLLRALQERKIKRLGGTQEIKLDIRIIAATNQDLRCGFRQDLYYRLNVIRILTPSLRDRPEDILVLARHFASIHSWQRRAVSGISTAAGRILESYGWPGNVRELQNTIEHAVTMGSEELIVPQDLPDLDGPDLLDYHGSVAATQRDMLERAYALAGGDHLTLRASRAQRELRLRPPQKTQHDSSAPAVAPPVDPP
ncbi:MAG TPA: sigma 54-interacting transcriptional regulator [Terriglobia bacterium]|nr:sigma 54-interacting transcriptional regulator [Terriglobia bacterium]